MRETQALLLSNLAVQNSRRDYIEVPLVNVKWIDCLLISMSMNGEHVDIR